MMISSSNFKFIPIKSNITTEPDSLLIITITAVGDLMCHSPQFSYAQVTSDSFDFKPVYREVRKILEASDFTYGNLETVIGKKKDTYKGYPRFNSPPHYVEALKYAGFDLLVTANNHTLDQGESGVLRTLESIKKYELNYTGSFLSETDRDSIRIFDVKGLKLAVLSYSYGTNGMPIPKGKNYIINLIDKNLIQKDIFSARKKGAEIVLVNFHFGNEYEREPSEFQKDVVDFTIQSGADIILGGHPHVLQPVDFFKTKLAKLDSGFVAYSLGNFISNQRKRFTDAGVILTIELTKNLKNDSVFISNVDYLPTWVFKGDTEKGKEYVILPLDELNDSSYTFLNNSDLSNMRQAFNDTKLIITKYNSKVKLYSINKIKK